MTVDPGPHDIDATRVVLTPCADAVPVPVVADFYSLLDRRFGDFAGHVLISRHSFTEAWPTWEMHPKGDEIVCLLSGDADFVLWRDSAEQIIRVARAGDYVVVPRGTWHTVRPHAPTAMLFVTPGEGTQNAATPGGD